MDKPTGNGPSPGYQETNYDLKKIGGFLLILGVVAFLVHVLMWGAFVLLDSQRKSEDPRVSPMLPAKQVPPEPRLQAQRTAIDTPGDAFDAKSGQSTKAADQDELNSYGWVDRQNGVVRIPISIAMKKIVEQNKQ